MIGKIYVTFMSFDPGSVRYLLERIPARHLCQLVTEVDEEWIDELVLAGETDRAGVAAVLARAMTQGVELLDSGVPATGRTRRRLRAQASLACRGMDAPGRDLPGLDRRRSGGCDFPCQPRGRAN